MPKQIPERIKPENMIGHRDVMLNQLVDWAHGVEERLKPIGSNSTAANPQPWQSESYAKPPRWRAAVDGSYWVVSTGGEVDTYEEEYHRYDDFRYNTGNYFQTKEMAIAYRDSLLAKFS